MTKKEYGAITNIDFCPTTPHYFAVTNSTRVSEVESRGVRIQLRCRTTNFNNVMTLHCQERPITIIQT